MSWYLSILCWVIHSDRLGASPPAAVPLEGAGAGADGAGAGDDGPLVTFSHFLPRPELLLEKRFLLCPQLPKAAGSRYLGARLAALRPALHVFGHTHFSMDKTINNIRYVQQPLGNPEERKNGWQIHCDESAPFAQVWPPGPPWLHKQRKEPSATMSLSMSMLF